MVVAVLVAVMLTMPANHIHHPSSIRPTYFRIVAAGVSVAVVVVGDNSMTMCLYGLPPTTMHADTEPATAMMNCYRNSNYFYRYNIVTEAHSIGAAAADDAHQCQRHHHHRFDCATKDSTDAVAIGTDGVVVGSNENGMNGVADAVDLVMAATEEDAVRCGSDANYCWTTKSQRIAVSTLKSSNMNCCHCEN